MKFQLLFFITAVFYITSCQSPPKKDLPNIVLITADDLGWSDIGCYGSEIETPNLDKLAFSGMRFTSFYNTSKCFPSRAALVTGVYAQDCGYNVDYHQPIRNAVTLGEVLKTAGYLTYWSGKHHGLENPYDRGFDHYFGLKEGDSNHFNPGKQREGEPQPAQKRNDRPWCIDSIMYQPFTPEKKDFYTTDYFTNYGLEYIDEASQSDQPFFLYLAYTAPHDPLMAWPKDIEKYKNMYDVGYETIRRKRYQKQLELGLIDSTYALSEPTHDNWEDLSDSVKAFEARKMEVYAAMIDRLDQNIGRVLNKLESLDLRENTLILFASDNGASPEVVNLKNDNDNAEVGAMDRWVSLSKSWANVANTPFRLYKNRSYEGGINTPFIINWTGKTTPGQVSNFPGHFIDVMATLVDLTKANYPSNRNGEEITPMRGVSLLPLIEEQPISRDEPLYWEWWKGRAMRKDQWKIVKQGLDNPWDLYNLGNDPTETENLAETHPDIVNSMDSIYQSWFSNYE